MAQALAQRPAAGDRVAGVGAQQVADAAVDEPVRQGVGGPELEGGAGLGIQGAGVLDGDLGGPAEGPELEAAPGLGVRGVVDLLHDAGHRQHVGGAEALEVGQQGGHVGGVAEHALAGDGQQLQAPGVGVRQRQEQQQARVLGEEQVGDPAHAVPGQAGRHEVGDLHALGPAGGAGGVDDGEDVVAAHGLRARVQVLAAHLAARLGDGGQGVAVQGQDPHLLPLGVGGAEGVGGLADDVGQGDRLGDDQADLRVGEDPLDLLGRVGLVDGHRDQARAGDGHVQQGPLVGGVRHDAHGLALLQAQAHEPGGDAGDVLAEAAGRDGDPGVAQRGLALDDRGLRVAVDALGEQPRDRPGGIRLGDEVAGRGAVEHEGPAGGGHEGLA